MSDNTKTYEVFNPNSGHSMGRYDAESPELAVMACWKDAGYDESYPYDTIEGTLEAEEVQVVTQNDLDVAAGLMDPDLREQVHAEMAHLARSSRSTKTTSTYSRSDSGGSPKVGLWW
jgi:hypothetical protein